MCNKCGENKYPYLHIIVYKDDNRVVTRLCPNCMGEVVYNREFPRVRGVYTSELSGAHGALKVVDAAESDNPSTYFLLSREAEKLFRHELTPEEFMVLDRHHHWEFLLHDDFYDPGTGEALQPMESV